MPRDLFGEVSSPSISLGSRKWYTVPLSLATHVAVLVPLVLVPLLASDILPMPRTASVFVVAPPTPPEPPRPVATRPPDAPRPADPNVAPLVPPESITPESGLEPLPDVAAGRELEMGGVIGAVDVVLAPPPVAEPPAPKAPIRPGGQIQAPVRTQYVAPLYPAIAQAARVQGTVILEAIIGTDGRVQDVRVLRSIPLLDQAATDAVRQWLYTATRLNGVPVSVIMTVTVTFTLTR